MVQIATVRSTGSKAPMLKPIGWWIGSFDDRDYPAPQELVREWPPDVQAVVVRYLAGGRTLDSYMGHSWCRFGCGIAANRMGSADLTDGRWIWPQGLAHYVEVHSVGLPEEFVAHALSGATSNHVEEGHPVDWDYWTRWCRERRSPTIVALREKRLQAALAIAATQADQEIAEREREQATSGDRCLWRGCTRFAQQGAYICGMHGISRESIIRSQLDHGFVEWVRGLPVERATMEP